MFRSARSLSHLRLWSIVVLALLGMALLAAHVPRSRAAPPLARPAFVVNSEHDASDANLGDAACAAAGGACTLRAAVQQANALGGPDSITLPPGLYTLTISGTDDLAAAGDLDITDDLTISGMLTGTTTIDAGLRDRIFDVYTTTVTLANLGMQNGNTSTNGGGIYNRGTLTLTNTRSMLNTAYARGGSIYNAAAGVMTISNSVVNTSSASSGGAIYNSGTLAVENTTFTVNRASGGGGAVANNGTLRMTRSTLRGNVAAGGGALYQAKGTLTLQGSTVAGNVAMYGGGITVDKGGTAIIEESTFSGNKAAQSGGGVYNNGSVRLVNSTFSGNQAEQPMNRPTQLTESVAGGGIWNNGDIMVLNATLVHNAAATGSAVQNSGVITFTNSIVASNDSEVDGKNCIGTIVSGGHNIENGNTCGFNQQTDLRGVSPQLGELRFNGGATKTHPLMPGSPAIDSGANVGCPATDQRGVTRPQGPRCDIGAFELEQPAPPTATLAPVTTSISEPPTATPTPPPATPTETLTATPAPPTSAPTETPTSAPTAVLAPAPLPTTAPTGTQRVLLPLVMK